MYTIKENEEVLKITKSNIRYKMMVGNWVRVTIYITGYVHGETAAEKEGKRKKAGKQRGNSKINIE